MKLYYNPEKNMLGFTLLKQSDILIQIEEENHIFMVMTNRWLYIGDI